MKALKFKGVLVAKDNKYMAWIRRQPSCVSGHQDWFEKYGEGRCVYAHIRRARNSGVGHKPLYHGVPLTQAEHQLQHDKGEKALLEAYRVPHTNAKQWFDDQATEYLARWKREIGSR